MLLFNNVSSEATASGKKRGNNILSSIGHFFGNNGILVALLALIIVLTILSPHFFSWSNFMNVARSAVPIAVIAFGMVFVIGMGEIDLSVGPVMVLVSIFYADMIQNRGMNIYLAMVVTLLLGAAIGAINATLITKARITPFIATLAIAQIAYGINMVYSHGVPIYGLSYPEVQFIDQAKLFTVPISVILTIIVGIICALMMYRMKFGRYVLSIGSNTEAARLVGIHVHRIKYFVYMLVGLLSALASIIITSKMEAAVPDGMVSHELNVIAATVLGGTSMTGGKAKIWGALFGALLMILVQNGINLLNINTFWQKAVVGFIILIAVGIDTASTYRNRSN
jgi:ribose transport system permease protein